jgi:hypothetical protein
MKSTEPPEISVWWYKREERKHGGERDGVYRRAGE